MGPSGELFGRGMDGQQLQVVADDDVERQSPQHERAIGSAMSCTQRDFGAGGNRGSRAWSQGATVGRHCRPNAERDIGDE